MLQIKSLRKKKMNSIGFCLGIRLHLTLNNNFMNYHCREFAKTANEIEKRAQESRKLDGFLLDDEIQSLDGKPRGSPDGIEAPPRSKQTLKNHYAIHD